jgi:hypothetical protein
MSAGARPAIEPLEARLCLSGTSSVARTDGVIDKMTQLSGNAEINGVNYGLSIKSLNGSAINPAVPTWLMIPGLDETPADMNSVGHAIAAADKGVQVLVLNWSDLADKTVDVKVIIIDYQAPNPFPVEDAVPAVGAWAEGAMAGAGFDLADLNIVGHSYGAYVGEEMAMDAPHGINAIVALDPGQDFNQPGVFSAFKSNLEQQLPTLGVGTSAAQAYTTAEGKAGTPFFVNTLNFQTDTQHSWAFYADDSFGDAAEAATAAEAFSVFEPSFSNGSLIDVPLVTSFPDFNNQVEANDNTVKMFANLINDSVKGKNATDLFTLNNLLDGASQPWKADQISAGPPLEFDSKPIVAVEPAQMFDAEFITSSDGIDLKTLTYVDMGDVTVTDKI